MRHGQSVANVAGVSCGGDSDLELTERGQEQARSMIEKLQDLKRLPGCIIVSPLQRTLETACIINESLALEIHVKECLVERFLGDWNGQPSTITDKLIKEGASPPNGESSDKFRARVLGCFEKLSASYSDWPLIIGSRGSGRILSEEFNCECFRDLPNCGLISAELATDPGFWITSACME